MPVSMSKKVKKPVVGSVEAVDGKTGKVLKQETVPVAEVIEEGPMANVGFSAAYTKNLGNYESVKVSVSLHLPVRVKPDADNTGALDDAFLRAQGWVDEKITAVLDEMDE